MDSFIIIEGLPLWIFLTFLLVIVFCLIYLGVKYVEELREHDATKQELISANRETDCVRCELARKNQELNRLRTNIQLAKLEVD